jgi:hypothetical protein
VLTLFFACMVSKEKYGAGFIDMRHMCKIEGVAVNICDLASRFGLCGRLERKSQKIGWNVSVYLYL